MEASGILKARHDENALLLLSVVLPSEGSSLYPAHHAAHSFASWGEDVLPEFSGAEAMKRRKLRRALNQLCRKLCREDRDARIAEGWIQSSDGSFQTGPCCSNEVSPEQLPPVFRVINEDQAAAWKNR